MACACNCTSTAPYHWVHVWKTVCSCVNVAVHLSDEKTVLFLHGKRNYKILASTVCIVKHTTENCSFRCTGSWERALWRQPGLVEKHVCGSGDLCCVSHCPPYLLWHFVAATSEICMFSWFLHWRQSQRYQFWNFLSCVSMTICALPDASASESKLFSTFCGFGGRARLENTACIHPWGSYNDKMKGENELFLLLRNPFCFLGNWLMMFAWFRVGNVYWSTDRIL